MKHLLLSLLAITLVCSLNSKPVHKINEAPINIKQVTLLKPLKGAVVKPKAKLAEIYVAPPKPVVVASAPVSGNHNSWMIRAGISESDFNYVNYIVSHESGWNYLVWNGSGSGAYGLCQALGPQKMASAGSDYMVNPVTQLKWCDSYAKSRYGSWYNSYINWTINHWW